MMKRIALLLLCFVLLSNSYAQLKPEDILNKLENILGEGKLLRVDKGFNPVFHLGNIQINKVGILGEKLKGVELLGDIFNNKHIDQVNKLYKTYKTGLIVFKVLAGAGTAVAVYSTVRGAINENHFNNKTVQAMLYPALASMASGVITKVITKKASYKAVDVFNGVVKEKVKDIFSIGPASQTAGIGIYVKL